MAKSEKMSELVPGGVRTREGLVLRLVERQPGDCYERTPVLVEGRFWEVTLEETAAGQAPSTKTEAPSTNIQAPENNQAPITNSEPAAVGIPDSAECAGVQAPITNSEPAAGPGEAPAEQGS